MIEHLIYILELELSRENMNNFNILITVGLLKDVEQEIGYVSVNTYLNTSNKSFLGMKLFCI